jgi:hypothetical protein
MTEVTSYDLLRLRNEMTSEFRTEAYRLHQLRAEIERLDRMTERQLGVLLRVDADVASLETWQRVQQVGSVVLALVLVAVVGSARRRP